MTTSTLPAAPIVSVKPVEIPADGRPAPLRARVTAPLAGSRLPVVVLSHGNGWSMDGYAPLAEHWAGEGFAVVQPTHLDSRSLGLGHEHPQLPDVWRWRIADLVAVIDQLPDVVAAVPGLAGRVDVDRVAVAGHSWGAQTAGALLGAGVLSVDGRDVERFADPRVRAGVLLAAAGTGDTLTPFAAERLPFMRPDYASMGTPTLVVAGDADRSALSTRGPDWFTDAYHLGAGADALLTLTGGEHSLGGVVGHEVAETTDASPARVALVQRATTAWLRTRLGVEADAWPTVVAELGEGADDVGHLAVR
ncbi:alpha/beta hydrolase family protein [Cellulosimicrobium sp. NPDC057127]|uniref:alpha/beta hydrolase family protein n=1 Tax=Cellulosimicrobium sp. NPDC057127 TaxID=3346026 RepID=UPI003642CB7F